MDFLPEYLTETRASRGFTPRVPISPFDDFYLEVDIKYCPGWTPEQRLSLGSQIAAGADINAVASPGDFQLRGASNGIATYRWTLRGWVDSGAPVGITTAAEGRTAQANMDLLGNAIYAGGPVQLVMLDPDVSATDWDVKYYPLSMTPCVHVSGDHGKRHKIVQTRGKDSGLNAHALMVRQNEIEVDGFLRVDPFKALAAYFRHYVDIAELNDIAWPRMPNGSSNYFTDDTLPSQYSSCGADGSLYMHHNSRSYFAYALRLPGRAVFLNPNTVLSSERDDWGLIAIHEAGHAFCALQDEYDRGSYGLQDPAPNCSTQPEVDWLWDLGTDEEDVHWGGQIVGTRSYRIKGCGYLAILRRNPLEWVMTHRPTNMSIMNAGLDSDPDAVRFNEVSCANCAYYIKNFLTPRDYLLNCRYDWNTVRSPVE